MLPRVEISPHINSVKVYIDTSIIIEALEQHARILSSETVDSSRTVYPLAKDGRQYRTLIRGFASYWTDRPFFRITTGLIPSSVWRTHFGKDRAGLIGHALDAGKLEAKVVGNMAGLDMHLVSACRLISCVSFSLSILKEYLDRGRARKYELMN